MAVSLKTDTRVSDSETMDEIVWIVYFSDFKGTVSVI